MQNKTIIETDSKVILFSYRTPVAFFDRLERVLFETQERHSVTTSRHRNDFRKRFSDEVQVKQIPQDTLESYLDGINVID